MYKEVSEFKLHSKKLIIEQRLQFKMPYIKYINAFHFTLKLLLRVTSFSFLKYNIKKEMQHNMFTFLARWLSFFSQGVQSILPVDQFNSKSLSPLSKIISQYSSTCIHVNCCLHLPASHHLSWTPQ